MLAFLFAQITQMWYNREKRKRGFSMTNLQELRLSNSLSQSDLAKISGVPIRNIRAYEQGTRNIDSANINTLLSLCLALKCSIGDLLEDTSVLEKYEIMIENL